MNGWDYKVNSCDVRLNNIFNNMYYKILQNLNYLNVK